MVRDTGDPPVYVSNVAIFLLEWVTCTDYSHPVGCPYGTEVILCVSRRVYSDYIVLIGFVNNYLCINFLFTI